MEYSNPKVPEGINVTPEHPLKEVAQLAIGALVLVALFVAAVAYGVEYLARYIPFHLEEKIAATYGEMLPKRTPETEYLQRLADRLSAAQNLPEDVRVRVNYVDEDTVNAMATIGGQVFVFRGLIEAMPSENALAMVLAHEIAHVKHRDPIVALGRGVVIGLGLAALGVTSGSDAASQALGQAGLLTQLTFNRDQERDADREALHTLAALYGHVQDTDTAFERLMEAAGSMGNAMPEILSTHPDTRARIETLRAIAKEHGYAATGKLTLIKLTLIKTQPTPKPPAKPQPLTD